MYSSDFTNSKSIHDYLLQVFLSETGLLGFGASHQELQYNALVIISKDLKSNLTKADEFGFSVQGFENVKISKREEAVMMLEVLSSVNSMNKMSVDPLKIMQLAVYPKITKMINSNEEIRSALKIAYDDLVQSYHDKQGKTFDSALAIRVRKTIESHFKIKDFFSDEDKNNFKGVKI